MSPETPEFSPAALTALTRSQLYALVAQAFAEPPATLTEWQARGRELDTVAEAAARLPASDSLRDSLAALHAASDRLAAEADLADLRSTYLELFGHLRAGPCPPYETEYAGQSEFVKNNDLADLMGFYHAFGLDLAGGERPDYIGVELEFLHFLALKEAIAQQEERPDGAAVCIEAQKKFLCDHLGRWAGGFTTQLSKLGDDTFAFYRALGRLLATLVEWDSVRQGTNPQRIQTWTPGARGLERVSACGTGCSGKSCSP